MKFKKLLLISLILLFVLSLGFSSVSAIDSDNLNSTALGDSSNINDDYMIDTDSNDQNDNNYLNLYDNYNENVNENGLNDNSKSKNVLKDDTNTIYVSLDGSDENDGLTRETAVASISHAVSIAGERYTIYLSSGTYAQSSSTQLSKALTFVGEDGTVISKTGTSNVFTYTSDTIKTVGFKNIIFSSTVPNPSNPILSMAGRADLLVDNCTITNAIAGRNGIIRLMGNSTGRITNTRFDGLSGSTNAGASYLYALGDSRIRVENSTFSNIDESMLRACVYQNYPGANLTLVNSVFNNINGNIYAIVENKNGYMQIQNCRFIDNSLSGNGPRGIVWSSEYKENQSFTYINSSQFINNSIDNEAIANASVIQCKSPTTVEYSAFLNNDASFIVNNDNETSIIANYNWWGTNQNPKNCTIDSESISLVSSGVDVDNWAIMTVEFETAGLLANENYPIIININQYINENGDIDALQYGIDAEILLDSQIGQFNSSYIIYNESQLNHGKVYTTNGTVTLNYMASEEGSDEIKFTSGFEEITYIVDIGKSLNYIDIYVSKSGNDFNDGLSNDTPVLTIGRALEMAKVVNSNVRIHIDEGTYLENGLELNDTYILYDEGGQVKRTVYSFIGYGNVVIDGNGADKSIFSIRNNSASFKNIRFTNVNSPQRGGAINVRINDNWYIFEKNAMIISDLTINNCTFDNMNVSSAGGAIYYEYGSGSIVINNTKFYNLSASSSQGGAINIQESDDLVKLKITGSEFRDNFANNAGAMYLRVSNLTVKNTKFINNSAKFYPGVMQFYNVTGNIENCIIANNSALKTSAAIYIEEGSDDEGNLISIRSCIIENNTASNETAPAIYVYKGNLDVSYSSLVNDLSLGTRRYFSNYTGLQEGTAIANSNWWGISNPFGENEIGADEYLSSLGGVINGSNITIDSWVILNTELNDTGVLKVGNVVNITFDFNHLNTTSGEIIPISGGKIPREYELRLNATGGQAYPNYIRTVNGIGNSHFTVLDTEGLGDDFLHAYLDIKSDNEIVNLVFEINNYKGVIFVSVDGNDDRNGSMDAPVRTMEKAIELALDEDYGSHEIFILPGTYEAFGLEVDYTYLTITGSGVDQTTLDGMGYTGGMFSIFQGELTVKNLSLVNGINTASSGGAFTNMGNLTLDTVNVTNCQVKNVNGGVIYSVGNLNLINSSFVENKALSGDSASGGVIYSDGYYTSLSYPPSINITGCEFISNSAGSQTFGGGVIYMQYVDGLKSIKNSKFINNRAYAGGAILMQNSEGNFTIDNVSFIGNRATGGSSCIYGGGAIALVGATDHRVGNVTITNSQFINNSASNTRGGGAILDRNVDLNITNSVIYNNKDSDKNTQIYKDTTVYFPSGGRISVEDNWWGVNNLSELSVSPANVTINRWVVMDLNVEAISDYEEYGELDPNLNNYLISLGLTKYNDGTPIGDDKYPFDRLYLIKSNNGQLNQSSGTLMNNIGTAILSSSTKENIIVATIDNQSLEFNTGEGLVQTVLDINANNSVRADDGLNVSISLKDIDNNPINGSVIINVSSKDGTIGEDIIRTVNVTDGTASEIIDGLKAGNFTVTATFNGYSNYLASNDIKDLEVMAIPSSIEISGYEQGDVIEISIGKGYLAGTLKSDKDPIANKNVSLIVDDGDILSGVTDENGLFVIDLSGLKAGNYSDLAISFDGDEIYEASSQLVNIKVNRIGAKLNSKLEDELLTVSLSDDKNDPIANRTVSVEVSEGLILNGTTNESGQAEFDLSNIEPGKYNLAIVFAGDDLYDEALDDLNFTVDKYDTSLVAKDTEGNVGSINLTALLTSDGKALKDKTVLLNIANQTLNATSDENGILIFDLSSLDAGIYDANIVFEEDNSYKNCSFAVKVTINKLNAEISSKFEDDKLNVTLKYGDSPIESKNITVTITKIDSSSGNGSDGSNNTNDTIAVINTVTDKDGVAIIDLSDLEASDYNAVISAAEDDRFNSIEDKINFTIDEKAPPKAIRTGEDLQKLIDEASAGDIIDLGEYDYVNVSDINITKDISLIGNNTSIVSAGDGNPIFNIAEGLDNVKISEVDFKVNNGDVIVKANAQNGTDPLSIDVPAIEISNNTVSGIDDSLVGESVTVLELDSERSILAPDNEIAIVANTLESGIKPFEFKVGEFENSSSANVPIGGNIPSRQATVIHYHDMVTSTVNTAIEGRVGKYFEVNLTDANGNPLANKEVKIGFNGKVYNKTTNATGGVRLQINLAKKGLYTFAISFLGDEKYNASFEVSKINVTVQKTKLTTSNKSYKASAKTKTLTVTLKSAEYNKALPSKKITVTVNGKSYTATTNSKGVATVKVSLSAKKTYSFTAKFAGDDRYAAASVSGKVTIK